MDYVCTLQSIHEMIARADRFVASVRHEHASRLRLRMERAAKLMASELQPIADEISQAVHEGDTDRSKERLRLEKLARRVITSSKAFGKLSFLMPGGEIYERIEAPDTP